MNINQIKIGHNAKGNFQISDNTVELRALGRALAYENQSVTFMQKNMTDATTGEIVKVQYFVHQLEGETRYIYFYDVLATAGAKFMRMYRDDKITYSNLHTVIPAWADGKTHRMWQTVVVKNNAVRMSRANYAGEYVRYANKQAHMGITAESELWINPLARLTKDAFIAVLAIGRTIGIQSNTRNDVIELLETFKADEERIIAGLPYVKEEA